MNATASGVSAGRVARVRPQAEEKLRVRWAANRAGPRRHDVTDVVMSEHFSGIEPPGEGEEYVPAVAGDVSLPQEVVAVGNVISQLRR